MNEEHSKPAASNEHPGLGIGVALGLSFGVVLGITLDNLALWLSVGMVIGLAAGTLYDASRKKRTAARRVKTLDGATYTLSARTHPSSHQRSHYWLGDNGQELELTDAEAAELL
ncbi:hypothetical protein [Leucobacter sp. NPDC077196]|uniref:hypothetical protein n=1 Tax=Leucobacter sp. NPDC077196 TaxID=3154959 RepID=UPI003422118B